MAVSGAGSRLKGKRAELEMCTLLRDHLGDEINGEITATRNLQQTREGGYDIGGAVATVVAIEVKNETKPRWPAYIKQTLSQAAPHQMPIVSYRKPGGGWQHIAILDDMALMELIRERLASI